MTSLVLSLTGRPLRLLYILRLAFAGLVLLPGTNHAGIDPAIKAQSDDWDQNLNTIYQQGLQTLPPARRAALRDAQRAWLDFREKSGAATIQAGKKRGLTENQLVAMDTFELATRYEEIKMLVYSTSAAMEVETTYDAADASLNDVYKRLLATLDEADKKRLREAQRAWVTFRDADAKLTAPTSANGKNSFFSILDTKHRVEQLRGMLTGTPAAIPSTNLANAALAAPQPVNKSKPSIFPAATPVVSQTVETADPSIPDPFASAR